ncbi:MAG: hypothetical protein RLZZ455_708 [Candidatus Parcubacteria bacterium]|jgi:A/G-specific adenine glycosylase
MLVIIIFMQCDQKNITRFQKKILAWYTKNKRDLPWRNLPFDLTLQQRDPYKILVSEVMLQQTQVGRVIPKYSAWMEKFPDVTSLATASQRDVLSCWSGLGYNRRALSLQKAAKMLCDEYNGVWPREKELLKKLPGVGEYTARALLTFAFHQQVAVVDTNVRRVILTQFQISNSQFQMLSDNQMQQIADHMLPIGKAYEWNQALMDYAALELKSNKIPLRKQSSFKGSRRFYRGKLLKLLLAEKEVTWKKIEESLFSNPTPDDRVMVHTVVSEMEKEGFVRVNKAKISLRN